MKFINKEDVLRFLDHLTEAIQVSASIWVHPNLSKTTYIIQKGLPNIDVKQHSKCFEKAIENNHNMYFQTRFYKSCDGWSLIATERSPLQSMYIKSLNRTIHQCPNIVFSFLCISFCENLNIAVQLHVSGQPS